MARIRPDADALTIARAVTNVQRDNALTADALITLADVTLALLAQVMTLNQAVLDMNANSSSSRIRPGTLSQLRLFRDE
jgi:hypothetical protein